MKPKPADYPTETQSKIKPPAPPRPKEMADIPQKRAARLRSTNHVAQAQPSGGTNYQLPIALESVPPHLQVLLQKSGRLNWPDLLAKLSTKDQPVLMQLYLQSTNAFERNSLTMALGMIGDEEVVALFKNDLTQEPEWNSLPSGYPNKADAENALCNTVKAMGFLAAKYDSAYDFIKQSADLKFWRDQIPWANSLGSDTAGMLTSYSIGAIGQSGRPDVPQVLEQFKIWTMANQASENDPTARTFSGSVVQAAFYYDVIQSHPIGNVHKTIDFIDFYESHYSFNRHTRSHRMENIVGTPYFQHFPSKSCGMVVIWKQCWI